MTYTIKNSPGGYDIYKDGGCLSAEEVVRALHEMEEEIADAYDDGYNEAKDRCVYCGSEFNRGVSFGFTMARMKLLECTDMDSDTALKVEQFMAKCASDATGDPR